jgi:hypothetical protein
MEICATLKYENISNNYKKRRYNDINDINDNNVEYYVSTNNKKRKYNDIIGINDINYINNDSGQIINKRIKKNNNDENTVLLIKEFKSLQIRKRKYNLDTDIIVDINDIENKSKNQFTYKCSIHDNEKSVCSIYNCEGIYNNTQEFMNYIN